MITISVKVIPKSSQQKLKWENDYLKVWLSSAPEAGKANSELVRTLAEKLLIPKGAIHIRKGKTSRIKIVDIEGITIEEIQKIA